MDIDELRKNFPVINNLIYFNHAAVGPMPLATSRKVEAFLRDYRENGCLNYPKWLKYEEKTRRLAAELVGGQSAEIALVKNTSTGLSMIAQGVDWKAGDNLIIPETEFPANAYPWFNLRGKGVEVRQVREKSGRYEPADFEALMDERTRLLSVSWVEFASGFMNDLSALGEICRKRDIYFCVDAIQGLGLFEMDVEKYHIDFLAADGHKWLLAPEGLGILYISNRVMDEVKPVMVGWHSVEEASSYLPYHFDRLKKDAGKFEEGSPNMLGTFALGASLELLLGLGIKNVGRRVLELTDRLAEGLTERGYKLLSPRGEGEKSGILVFSGGRNDGALFDYLGRGKIFCALRGGGIRLSPHCYNNAEEIAVFFDRLDGAPR